MSPSKLPMVLKVPRLNSSPLALCDRPFSLLGFGDILVPGIVWLVALSLDYCSCTSVSAGVFDWTALRRTDL